VGELRAASKVYLAALTIATAAITVAAFQRSSTPELRDSVLATAFCALQVLAVARPIELGPQQKVSLHTAVIFAAVLLFDPLTAILIAGIGSVIGQTIIRQPAEQVLFTSCQTALQAGVASLLLAQFAESPGIIDFDRASDVVGALLAAVVIVVIDVAAVALIIRLETGQSLRSLILEIPDSGPINDLSQLALGLLTAITVNAHAWTLPVVMLLGAQLYRAGQRSLAAQRHERQLRAATERIAHARQEFLLTASHELKTPITSVKMAAQLLDRAVIQRHPSFRADPDSIQRWRDQLMLGVERLETLVADLLDAARIQQGRLELHPERVDLSGVARAVVERFEIASERTPRHRLVLDSPDPVEGTWDPSGIDQVITNLVSNALKYSPDGGIVTVRVGRDGDNAVLIVSDTGIGIEPDQQAELFKPFARSLTTRHGISGTGLGPYITRRVVEQHGGTIALDSIPRIGTTITVTFPLEPAITIADPSEVTEAAEPRESIAMS
jgi:signal transduction histidine kinase